MSQYTPTLDCYSNGLPLVSTMYGSSECYFGINLNPFCKPSEVSYTLIPTMCYFEFAPIHRDNGVINSISKSKLLNLKEQNQLVDLVDVQIGQEYELVVTTYSGTFKCQTKCSTRYFFTICLSNMSANDYFAWTCAISGLYRYRVGDVLRVAGYKNNAPQFYFICRENVILSIDSDKTDEAELQNAVKNAVHNLIPFDATVIEYTSYADTTTIPRHYVLFWELNVNGST